MVYQEPNHYKIEINQLRCIKMQLTPKSNVTSTRSQNGYVCGTHEMPKAAFKFLAIKEYWI